MKTVWTLTILLTAWSLEFYYIHEYITNFLIQLLIVKYIKPMAHDLILDNRIGFSMHRLWMMHREKQSSY